MANNNFTLIFCCFLYACGGGGDGGNSTEKTSPEEATFTCQAIQCFGPPADADNIPTKLIHPVIVADQAWEINNRVQLWGSVVHGSDGFKMSYLGQAREQGIPWAQAYAESNDGIVWTKPNINGTDNIFLNETGSFGVFYDSDSGLYRGAGLDNIGSSTDMKTWTVGHWDVADINDTSTTCVKFKGEYICFVRNQGIIDGKPVRVVGITTSTDWENWTEKQDLIAPTNRFIQPYGLQVSVYGDKLVGVLWWYHHAGTFNSEIIWSENGRNWNRTNRVFMKPTPGTWDSGLVAPGAPVFVDGMVYFYYTGADNIHDSHVLYPEQPRNWAIGLATMPISELETLITQ